MNEIVAGLLEPWGLRLARPEALAYLVGFAAALAIVALFRRRRYVGHTLVRLPAFEALRPSPVRHLPRLLLVAGLVAASIALLDPRLASQERVTTLEALEVALVVDLSLSMKEPIGGLYKRPVYSFSSKPTFGPKPPPAPRPPRIEVMRRILGQIMDRRVGDRLALVVFSQNGYVVSPPTSDHAYLRHYSDLVDPDLLKGEGRTAIGEGVATAMGLFEHGRDPNDARPERGRVIIVFTDGENNAGRDPVAVVDAARRRGYRVYLIAMDLPEEAERKPTQVQLIRAVEQSGGRYYDARSEAEVTRASEAIDRVERGVFADRTIEHDIPRFQVFVLAALAAAYAGLALYAVPYFVDLT